MRTEPRGPGSGLRKMPRTWPGPDLGQSSTSCQNHSLLIFQLQSPRMLGIPVVQVSYHCLPKARYPQPHFFVLRDQLCYTICDENSFKSPSLGISIIIHGRYAITYRAQSSFQFSGMLIPGWGHAGQKIANSPGFTSLTDLLPPAYPAHLIFFIQRHIRLILRNSRYKSSTSPGAIGRVCRRNS